MKSPKSLLFWELLPVWVCGGFILFVSIINPDYVGVLFRPSSQPFLSWSVAGLLGMGLLFLLLAVLILSNLRSIWPKSRDEAREDFFKTWIACPSLLLLALVITLGGTFVVLLAPASITMAEQMSAIKNSRGL